MDALTEYTLAASKYALIILSLVIIVRCIRSMLSDRYEPEVWGYLWHESQTYTLTHWGEHHRPHTLLRCPPYLSERQPHPCRAHAQ